MLASTTLNMNFAVANMPGTQSYYNDHLGSDPPFLIHEIGHNLGFAHSNNALTGSGEYGDATCEYHNIRPDWGWRCLQS